MSAEDVTARTLRDTAATPGGNVVVLSESQSWAPARCCDGCAQRGGENGSALQIDSTPTACVGDQRVLVAQNVGFITKIVNKTMWIDLRRLRTTNVSYRNSTQSRTLAASGDGHNGKEGEA